MFKSLATLYLILLNLSASLANYNISNVTTSYKDEACVDGATITLTFNIYLNSCPEAEPIVFSWVEKAVYDDPRMAASLLRLHFHDCFVNGCDASVLLDDTLGLVGEKTAAPNANSLRGFEVIDAIKADLEYVCPQTVSCADILAIAARDSVVLSGGPGWEVEMGRKDSLSASKAAANNNIPGPNSDLTTLLSRFQNLGLSLQDMIALSGAHTLGKARCSTFIARLNNINNNIISNDPDINLEFVQSLQQLYSQSNVNTTLVDLDHTTPTTFDNEYYVNLVSGEGLLGSDQELLKEAARGITELYADDVDVFFEDFRRAMLKMGRIGNGGVSGEIRRNCRVVN
ncbi:Peroxidase 40 [Castilleja foliolosa]|uniref:Peroxidase n=1 Tax=Castilleja foliolosa TaxID=1961234 RepID=A0ABD3DJ38_9LAMI